MSESHLTTGSQRPPKVDGKLRLYSMKFCPYAQRPRLILKAKGIPHDIVNINLMEKPEWYFEIHTEGKVPALDTGSEVIVESLDVCDYLEEKYPNPPLYPKDSKAKQDDKDLITKIAPLTTVFARCVFGDEQLAPEEWLKEFSPHLDIFETELSKRGTYFGGENPGMVDYMLWPWGERAGTVALKLGQQLPLGPDQFPLLRKWRKAMREQPVCSEIYNGPQKFWKIVLFKLKDLPANYDEV